jgi:UDP-glucose:glycoprotein glucosyltransferase
VDLTELSEILIQVSIETLKVQQLYCRHLLNVPEGGRAIVTNGKILGPLEQTEKFTLDDFSLLERFSLNSYGDKILQTFRKKTADSDDGNTYLFLFIVSEFLTTSGKEWGNACLLRPQNIL